MMTPTTITVDGSHGQSGGLGDGRGRIRLVMGLESPGSQQKDVGADKDQGTDEGRHQMQEIDIAHHEMNADRGSEAGAAHDRDNLDEAAVEFRKTAHEKQEASNRTESAAKTGAVMGDDRNERWGDVGQAGRRQADESQVRRHEDRRHTKNGYGGSGQDQSGRAGAEQKPAGAFQGSGHGWAVCPNGR